jgi:two-component system phosphate regulon response regulator PhoB
MMETEISVILVDDEPRVASALSFATEGTEIRLRAVSDAEQLWRELAVSAPAVILLDLQLGDRSGLELCAELRSRPEMAKVPILALSGFTDPKVKEAAFSAGFDDYIVKPFSPEELLVRIRAHVRRAGNGDRR